MSTATSRPARPGDRRVTVVLPSVRRKVSTTTRVPQDPFGEAPLCKTGAQHGRHKQVSREYGPSKSPQACQETRPWPKEHDENPHQCANGEEHDENGEDRPAADPEIGENAVGCRVQAGPDIQRCPLGVHDSERTLGRSFPQGSRRNGDSYSFARPGATLSVSRRQCAGCCTAWRATSQGAKRSTRSNQRHIRPSMPRAGSCARRRRSPLPSPPWGRCHA